MSQGVIALVLSNLKRTNMNIFKQDIADIDTIVVLVVSTATLLIGIIIGSLL